MRSLKDSGAKRESALVAAGVAHDIREYPDADHAFMNDHSGDKLPFLLQVMAFAMGGAGGYHPEAAADSRARILAFFARHLQGA